MGLRLRVKDDKKGCEGLCREGVGWSVTSCTSHSHVRVSHTRQKTLCTMNSTQYHNTAGDQE